MFLKWKKSKKARLSPRNFLLPCRKSYDFLHCKKGTLLLEVMLSIVILSVSIALIIQTMTSSLRISLKIPQYTTALLLIENKMFDLKQKGFVESGSGEEDYFSFPFDQYQYSMETESSGEEETEGLNKIALKVLWNTRQKSHSVLMETYFRDKEE